MGVTKIWPVKDKLVRVLDYARDPEKTELKNLKAVLHYAANGEKVREESAVFVTGVNCEAATAYEEMAAVQGRFGKTGGNVAYHAYQSFKTGEVTPELCHRLGVELARQMWGDGYQVLVATHFNTGTYHNHFVVNSVGLWDGKKFDCNKRAYYRFRELSDRLCAEHCLTVIEKPQNRTPRNIYLAEKEGLPTRYNLMREAIDEAAAVSISRQEFVDEMKRLGYIVQAGPNRKYAAIRPIGSDRSTRMFRLGEGYDFPQVMERVWADAGGKVRRRQQERYQPARRKVITIPAQPRKMQGSFKKAKKVTGFMALCYHYCYLLGVFDRHKPKQQPLSPEMREACRKLDVYAKRIKVLAQYGLRTVPDVEAFIQVTGEKVTELTAQREKVRNRLRRCSDPEERKALTARRDRLTTQIKVLRDQNRTARDILAESGEMKRQLHVERDLRHGRTPGQERNDRNSSRRREAVR